MRYTLKSCSYNDFDKVFLCYILGDGVSTYFSHRSSTLGLSHVDGSLRQSKPRLARHARHETTSRLGHFGCFFSFGQRRRGTPMPASTLVRVPDISCTRHCRAASSEQVISIEESSDNSNRPGARYRLGTNDHYIEYPPAAQCHKTHDRYEVQNYHHDQAKRIQLEVHPSGCPVCKL
jgi:hypothetical protein